MLHLIMEHFLLFSKVENYRPVSLLTLLSKTIERAASKQVTEFLSKNNLLDPNQSGFKSGHSTETALLSVMEALKTARAAAQSCKQRLSSCLTYQLLLIQSTTASFCPYCQVWAFLAMRTPGLNPTSLGAHSTCHGKVSCLYLTTGLGVRTTSLCHLHHLVGPNHPLGRLFISLLRSEEHTSE